MMLGLSVEEWTALGSIGTLVGVAIAALSLWRRGDSDTGKENEGFEQMPEADASPAWPPDIRMDPPPAQVRLRRMDSGAKLLDVLGPALMYQLDNEEPANPDDVEMVADALRAINGWAEASDDIDPGDRVHAGFELTQLIEELAESGWSIYAASSPRQLVVAGDKMNWPTAIVHVARTKRAQAA